MFNSNSFQEGQLHFKFSLQSTNDRQDISNFQPHRRIFGIIGIMDCQEWKNRPLSEGYESFISSVEKYSTTPITRCFAFDPIDSQPDDTKGVIMIPNVGDIFFYLNTMMYDFASELLSQFSISVKEIGYQLGIESSAQSNTNNSSISMDDDLYRNSISESISPSPSSSSSSFNNASISSNNNSNNKNDTQNISSINKKLVPGRIKKIYGDFYLLAGKIPDAITYYRQSIDMTRITSDYLWLASAMEGYLCAIILLDQLKMEKDLTASSSTYENDIPLPSSPESLNQSGIDTSTSPPPTSSSIPSKPQIAVTDILNQYSTILSYYSKEIYKASSMQIKRKLDINDKRIQGSSITSDYYSLIYSEACLKVSRFLLTIYNSGKWDKETLYLLLRGTVSKSSLPLSPRGSLPDTPVSMSHLDKYNHSSYYNQTFFKVERVDINMWTTKIWESHIDRLSTIDQIYLLNNMAAIYSSIDYSRKASWTTLESIKRMQPLLLNNINSNIDKKLKPSKEPSKNDSILRVLKNICSGYGISGDEEHDLNNDENNKNSEIKYKNKCIPFGWPSLQLIVLRQCIVISEIVHDYDDMLYYTTILLKNLYPYLLKDEQIHLANSIQRIITRGKRSGKLHKDDNYWDINIILNIRALNPVPREVVHQHLSFNNIILDNDDNDDNRCKSSEKNSLNPSSIKTDPFIYNPFITPKIQEKKRLLVKNEIVEFEVILLNPFGYDLELQNISLSTSGISFNSIQSSTIIPAYQSSKINLSGVPEETGILTIRGCNIKIVGFTEQEFLFNSNKENTEMYAGVRLKHSGLKMKEIEKMQVEHTPISYFQLPVIIEQPFLKLRSTSLIQNAIMLFAGERNWITMTFENIGKIPIDFIGLTFTDNSPKNDFESDHSYKSVFSWNQKTSKNGQMIGKKVWIEPGSTLDITFDIYGKRECSQGTVQVDYGYLNRYNKMDVLEEKSPLKIQNDDDDDDDDDDSKIFYTKQLYINILITVHQHLELNNWDIHYLRLDGKIKNDSNVVNNDLPSNSLIHPIMLSINKDKNNNNIINKSVQTWTNDQTSEDVINLIANYTSEKPTVLKNNHDQDNNTSNYCLATVDIKNQWTFPVDVQFIIDDKENDDIEKNNNNFIHIKNRIEPGTTIRALLPIKRMLLSDHNNEEVEPTNNKNQSEIIQINKYRTNILQQIKATWSSEVTSNTIREGDLDMNTVLKLTLEQLHKLKKPIIQFNPILYGSTVKQVNYKHFACQSDQNITLKMIISNIYVKKPARFLLHLQPILTINENTVYTNLQDKVFIQGLNKVILPKISMQEKAQHEMLLYFLVKGRYEFIYHVQDIETKQIYYDHEKLIIDVTS
ncbi:unnamed protein product [Cunninghamella blakesleeana]